MFYLQIDILCLKRKCVPVGQHNSVGKNLVDKAINYTVMLQKDILLYMMLPHVKNLMDLVNKTTSFYLSFSQE